MTPMDDAQIGLLLRDGDEMAPAELRNAVRALVRREPLPHDDHDEPSMRRMVAILSAAAVLVLLVVGLVVVAGGGDDPAPSVDTIAPTTSLSSTSSTAPTVPATTILDAEVARLAALPEADPVTVAGRPGVAWPVPDVLPDGYTLARALPSEDEARRELVYFSPNCDVSDDDLSRCDDGLLITLSDREEDPPSSMPIIPLTPNGDVWVYGPPEPTDPEYEPDIEITEQIRACLTNPECVPERYGFSVNRRLGDALVGVSGNGLDMGTLTQIALSVCLVDETELARPPLRLDDDDFGPVVATTPDGQELRANTNGALFELTLPGDDFGVPSTYRSSPNDPVDGGYTRLDDRGIDNYDVITYGMTEPNVAELVFEFSNGYEPTTVVPGDLTGTFRHQFFMIEVPRLALRERADNPGTTIHALDANGNELATYRVTLAEGMWKLDQDR